jgi:hypothetical protein
MLCSIALLSQNSLPTLFRKLDRFNNVNNIYQSFKSSCLQIK